MSPRGLQADHQPPSSLRNRRPLTLPTLLWRGFWRRCPQCGAGGCFRSWFKVRERCPRCRFPLQREEGWWLGGIGMNTVVSFGLVGLALLVSFALTWHDRRGVFVFVPAFTVAIVVPVLFFGSSQTLWSAMHLALDPVEPRDGVAPEWQAPRKAR